MPNRSLHTPVAAMVGVLVIAPWVAAAEPSSQSPPSAPQPAISVQLSISVPEFNPALPKGAIRCVVTNRTARAIEIAGRYDGKQIGLIAPSHRWPPRAGVGLASRSPVSKLSCRLIFFGGPP